MNERVIAIGDVHGCAPALAALLAAIQPQPTDTIVPLGDYIDRGPQSRQTIDLLLDLSTQCQLVPLLGNHELMLLDALRSPYEREIWLNCGGLPTLDSYGGSLNDIPDRHLEFLRNCRPYHETDSHLFVHASYEPHLPLAEQPYHVLFWQHMLSPLPPPHRSGKIVVAGHTPQVGGQPRRAGHVILIDTYCFGGGWLTALDVTTDQIWQADKHGRLRA